MKKDNFEECPPVTENNFEQKLFKKIADLFFSVKSNYFKVNLVLYGLVSKHKLVWTTLGIHAPYRYLRILIQPFWGFACFFCQKGNFSLLFNYNLIKLNISLQTTHGVLG